MTAVPPDAHESRRWLDHARDDLAYGEGGMVEHPRPAAWSFQQAGEKALKAVLLAHGSEVPRTHDVAYLLSLLAKEIPAAKDLREAALVLATISPASRYPDDCVDIGVETAAELAQAARCMIEWAERQVRR